MTPPVRAEISFDSIRVWFGDIIHIDIRRSTYRGMQAWKWPGNWFIEFSLADTRPMLVEYTEEARWIEVLGALKTLPLNG